MVKNNEFYCCSFSEKKRERKKGKNKSNRPNQKSDDWFRIKKLQRKSVQKWKVINVRHLMLFYNNAVLSWNFFHSYRCWRLEVKLLCGSQLWCLSKRLKFNKTCEKKYFVVCNCLWITIFKARQYKTENSLDGDHIPSQIKGDRSFIYWYM